jgi:hypothetical protein
LITPPAEREQTEKEAIYAQAPLSTIRPTWSRPYSSSYATKTPISNGDAARPGSPKLGGSGGSGKYGKPVASPKVPGPTPLIKSDSVVVPELGIGKKEVLGIGTEAVVDTKPQIGGYKSFNPYLNRALTFSTFRPTTARDTTASPKPLTTSSSSCSSNSKPILNGSNGLTSPVPQLGQLQQSPTRLVK